MRDDCRTSAVPIKAVPGAVLRTPSRTLLRALAAVFLAVMFGLFLIVVFPAAESGSSVMDERAVPVRTVQRHGGKAYANGDVPLISSVSDLPVIRDIYDEYDLKVIHSLSAGQMKSLQGGIWKIVWMAAALFMLYVYKVFFQKGRLSAFRLPCFSCELMILLKKDGKKRCCVLLERESSQIGIVCRQRYGLHFRIK